MAKVLEDNFQEGDAYENLQFYYHTDIKEKLVRLGIPADEIQFIQWSLRRE